jgi:hypothetical protein
MKQKFIQAITWLKTLSLKNKLALASGLIITLAIIYCICGSLSSISKKVSHSFYGESIGTGKLYYKHQEHIYHSETGEILVDSIQWLHISYGDTIGILAKNNRRAYINLNTAELLTPLEYEKAWVFSCNRGIMMKNDSIYIFRRDGSLVNPAGFPYTNQYELLFLSNNLVVTQNDKQGLIDTAGQWVLEPHYTKIIHEHNNRLYNTRTDEQCIVYNYELDTVLIGNYKQIDIDWTEGIIATEHSGIQHLFSYTGEMIYKVIYKSIQELQYKTGRKDANGNDIWEPTNCYVYTDYNNKVGLMDKRYQILTPPLFYDITAQTKHTFFASFGEWSNRFGTLIDDHGKPIN